jgi:hypothetical protein
MRPQSCARICTDLSEKFSNLSGSRPVVARNLTFKDTHHARTSGSKRPLSRLRHPGRIHTVEAAAKLVLEPIFEADFERIIGSIRRECLDHVVVFNERHLRRVLSSYFQYYHRARTHLSLNKDCPQPRPVQPPSAGKIVAVPQVGGLHHRYERRAA